MTTRQRGRLFYPVLLLSALVLLSGCTRRQLVPGLIAGAGAVMTTSGAIYRATMDDVDGAFGDTPGQIAGSTILIFGGIGLLLTGIIWSITSSSCDENADCWSGDVCELRSHTCIDGDAARRLQRHNSNDSEASEDGEGDEEADEGEAEEDDPPSRGESSSDDDDEEEEFETPPYPG